MLGTLLESNLPRQRRRASTAASIAVHTAVIAGAIVATASAKPEPRPTERTWEKPPVYIPIANAEQRSTEGAATRRPTSAPWLEDVRPPGELILKYVPNDMSKPLRDIDAAGLLANDTLGPKGPQGQIGAELLRPLGDQPATAASVDKVAALLPSPRPRYPDQLRAAGVTGRVVVRVVVDTIGRVEPASVVIRESSHELFAQAVRAVLPALRFAAAEAGGRKVRMLVDLPFEFQLKE